MPGTVPETVAAWFLKEQKQLLPYKSSLRQQLFLRTTISLQPVHCLSGVAPPLLECGHHAALPHPPPGGQESLVSMYPWPLSLWFGSCCAVACSARSSCCPPTRSSWPVYQTGLADSSACSSPRLVNHQLTMDQDHNCEEHT